MEGGVSAKSPSLIMFVMFSLVSLHFIHNSLLTPQQLLILSPIHLTVLQMDTCMCLNTNTICLFLHFVMCTHCMFTLMFPQDHRLLAT